MLIHHADNKWAHLLAYVTEMVNQRLLLQCEYLSVANAAHTQNQHLTSRMSGC
jgi:hypothetical protein